MASKSETQLVSFNPDIPFIPEKAFFPLHPSGDGIYYSWRECGKRFIVCLRWDYKEIIFRFDDKEAMRWFQANDFGLKKRQGP
jgi:hypothetical protein